MEKKKPRCLFYMKPIKRNLDAYSDYMQQRNLDACYDHLKQRKRNLDACCDYSKQRKINLDACSIYTKKKKPGCLFWTTWNRKKETRMLVLITCHSEKNKPRCLFSVWYGIFFSMSKAICHGRGRNFLFNNVLNTFYIHLYGVRHIVKDHSDNKRRNSLPPLHGLIFSYHRQDSTYQS